MPIYVVELQGDNITIDLKPMNMSILNLPTRKVCGYTEIKGFFTHRIIKADTKNDAVANALSMVLQEWVSEGFSDVCNNKPNIKVENVYKISFWSWLTRRHTNKGFSFYSEP